MICAFCYTTNLFLDRENNVQNVLPASEFSVRSYLYTKILKTFNKKLSYRRETARQLPTWRDGGARPSSPFPSAPSGYTYAYGWIRKPQRTYVKRAVRKAHFKMNRVFKVIQAHPYWCRQESRTVCCRNVQLMPTLFLKLTKIRQRENGKFVDFNDLMQVW